MPQTMSGAFGGGGNGFAGSFAGLLIARALVGAGGAAFGGAAQSLAADYFPSRGRAVAMGILSAGITLGGVLGIWLGGHLEAAYDWRTALFAVSLPGFVLAWLTARLRDPVRRARMVLLAADGMPLDQIARQLGADRTIVRTWVDRYRADGLAGLQDRPRPGRPRTFPP